MKKILLSFFVLVAFLFSFGTLNIAQADTQNQTTQTGLGKKAKYLDQIYDEKDIAVASQGAKNSIYQFTLDIAKAIKVIFFIVAIIYFMIITIKLMVASNTEEELSHFKKGFIWISIGIILINIAEMIVKSVYNQNMSLNGQVASNIKGSIDGFAEALLTNIIIPFIHILEFAAGFFFILIMIFAFFRLITANGNDENAKKGKMSVLYAIIGFIVVKLASTLVFAVYGKCNSTIATALGAKCNANGTNLTGFAKIIFEIINWLNSFVAVAVIILIIFIGAQIIFSNGDDEKISKAKKSLIYIVIGIAILLFNYLILTFFFNI